MARYLFPIGFVLVLFLPFVMRLAMAEDRVETDAASARLTVLTPHNPDIKREFARAFGDWHAEKFGYRVDLDYRNIGGTNDIVKALKNFYGNEIKNNGGTLPPIEDVSAPYDVVWGGGDFIFNSELEDGASALQAIELDDDLMAAAFPEPKLAGVRLYDQDDDGMHWVGVCLSSFGIVYSPHVYGDLGLTPPETWSDLTDPGLRDRLVLADPTKSGSAAVAYMMIVQRAMADAEEAFFAAGGTADSEGYDEAIAAGYDQGNGDLLLIAANTRYFTDSASAVPADVSHSNAAAGTAIDFYGRVEEETVGPDRIRYVAPVAATAITPDPVAVCYGTTGDDLKHATRFIEFLLTPEAQHLWQKQPGSAGGPRDRALRRTPIRRDVFDDTSDWADQNNPFDDVGGFNQRGAWMSGFSQLRAVWRAAWIESNTELDKAYEAVLAVDDPARRDALLEELADLPVKHGDVRAIRAEVKRIEDENEAAVSSYMAEMSSELAATFREHYRTIRDKASS
jgi:ABC-type Fe3+ transport system substrate-binding protein